MKVASPFSGFNSHAARLSLPRASATSWPILSANRHEVVLAKVLLTARSFATISTILAWYFAHRRALVVEPNQPGGRVLATL
jgi:hypothetical protein